MIDFLARAFGDKSRESAPQSPKRINLALQGARALGLALPHTASAQELMNAVAAHGDGKLDHSALCQAVELMADHKIAGN